MRRHAVKTQIMTVLSLSLSLSYPARQVGDPPLQPGDTCVHWWSCSADVILAVCELADHPMGPECLSAANNLTASQDSTQAKPAVSGRSTLTANTNELPVSIVPQAALPATVTPSAMVVPSSSVTSTASAVPSPITSVSPPKKEETAPLKQKANARLTPQERMTPTLEQKQSPVDIAVKCK